MSEPIEDIVLHEATEQRYLNYAMSVITARALPDVRDGLKPVQRRILYAMFNDLGLTPDSKPRKSAAVVGDVMGKYHPHGDSSIYDAMVRMAQDFSLRYPLVVGQGNFGSIDGDGAAAMRYTEAKLAYVAVELLQELRKDTVPMRKTYDGEREEPVVLPAQLPNLLINGASGIAVGMATNIPPHNLREVVDALVALIDEPTLTLEKLVPKYIKGPDFPGGGEILNSREELLEIYGTGSGSIESRGTWVLEEEGRRRSIILTSIPYTVNKSELVTEIADLIRTGKVPQLVDIRDESTDETRVVLDLSRDGNADAAMAFLCRRTRFQTRFAVNMTALCPVEGIETGRPRRLDLREMLELFLEFRYDVTRRRLQYDLAILNRRIHILRGFELIFDALDEAIAIIRASEGKADAARKLMARFELDAEQTDAILELRLYRLAQLEILAIRRELEEKLAQAARIEAILNSEHKMWDLIRSELAGLRDAFGDKRRTRVVGPQEIKDFAAETYIVAEDAFVIVTRDGWFKRQKSYTDISAIRVREGDGVGWIIAASTRETLVLFTDRGKAYTLRTDGIPLTTGYGEPISARFTFADGERIVGVVSSETRSWPFQPTDTNPGLVVALSAQGKAVRLPVSSFSEPSTVTGRTFIRLEDDNDRCVGVYLSDGTEFVSLATRRGRCINFRVDEINVLTGAGKGVLAIKIVGDDAVLGFLLGRRRLEGLKVETNRGRLEEVRPSRYSIVARGGRGYEIVRAGYIARIFLDPIVLGFDATPPPPDDPPDEDQGSLL
jgi:DNA gyrase subunit A